MTKDKIKDKLIVAFQCLYCSYKDTVEIDENIDISGISMKCPRCSKISPLGYHPLWNSK